MQNNDNSSNVSLTRRQWLAQIAMVPMAGAVVFAQNAGDALVEQSSSGRLSARLVLPTSRVATGLTPLNLGDSDRDGLLFVPASYDPIVPAPLALLLHGAGQRANLLMDRMRAFAEELGMVLVAVDSRGSSWDIIRGGYGPDVVFIDRALKYVFSRVRVDPARVTVAGFSDGASYALSIGRINGDLFRKIAAFSPGFVAEGAPVGKPRIYVSHGSQDQILSVENTRNRIVPSLKKEGYAVQYKEFVGPHRVPPDLAAATAWLAEL